MSEHGRHYFARFQLHTHKQKKNKQVAMNKKWCLACRTTTRGGLKTWLMGGSVADPGHCYKPCRLLCSSVLAASSMIDFRLCIYIPEIMLQSDCGIIYECNYETCKLIIDIYIQ